MSEHWKWWSRSGAEDRGRWGYQEETGGREGVELSTSWPSLLSEVLQPPALDPLVAGLLRAWNQVSQGYR